jgi:hypothetical protein
MVLAFHGSDRVEPKRVGNSRVSGRACTYVQAVNLSVLETLPRKSKDL